MHLFWNCFRNHKQLTRVTGWKNKSVFPWKDKVKGVDPAKDAREWTAPVGVPDNRAWIATQSEELYNKERVRAHGMMRACGCGYGGGCGCGYIREVYVVSIQERVRAH